MSSVTVPPTWDLPTLNVFIAQEENFLRGRLTGIRTDGPVTILDIDDESGEKPQSNTMVTVGAPPQGSRFVAAADIYIGTQPVHVTAYRTE